MSKNLRANKELERKEIEERIAECTHHIDDFRVSYQNLDNDIHQSKVISKTAEDVIATDRVVITKVQALIQDHVLKLANEKRKVEKLEITKHRVQKEPNDHSSELEALWTQLASKKFLSEEELRGQALAKVEKARQRDIQHLKNQIKSLAEWE